MSSDKNSTDTAKDRLNKSMAENDELIKSDSKEDKESLEKSVDDALDRLNKSVDKSKSKKKSNDEEDMMDDEDKKDDPSYAMKGKDKVKKSVDVPTKEDTDQKVSTDHVDKNMEDVVGVLNSLTKSVKEIQSSMLKTDGILKETKEMLIKSQEVSESIGEFLVSQNPLIKGMYTDIKNISKTPDDRASKIKIHDRFQKSKDSVAIGSESDEGQESVSKEEIHNFLEKSATSKDVSSTMIAKIESRYGKNQDLDAEMTRVVKNFNKKTN